MIDHQPRKVSRRTLLRTAAGWSVVAGIGGILAACGESGDRSSSSGPISAGIGGASPVGTARPLYSDEPTDPEPTAELPATPSPTATPAPRQLVIASSWDRASTEALVAGFASASDTEVTFDVVEGEALAEALASDVAADILLFDDPAAINQFDQDGLLEPIPSGTTSAVASRFLPASKSWVPLSARVSTMVYNPNRVDAGTLPVSVSEITNPRWRARFGLAPASASVLSIVAAMIEIDGQAVAERWLATVISNRANIYDTDAEVVQAIIDGDIDAGIADHGDLHVALRDSDSDLPLANHWFGETEGYDPDASGDPGAALRLSGAAIVEGTENLEAVIEFIDFLLSPDGQQGIVSLTNSYPIVAGIDALSGLRPLDQIQTPDIGWNVPERRDAAQTLLGRLVRT